MTLVAPSDRNTPVRASETCMTWRANEHDGCVMCWWAAVMLQLAV